MRCQCRTVCGLVCGLSHFEQLTKYEQIEEECELIIDTNQQQFNPIAGFRDQNVRNEILLGNR